MGGATYFEGEMLDLDFSDGALVSNVAPKMIQKTNGARPTWCL